MDNFIQSLCFVHPSLDLMSLFTGMQERSIGLNAFLVRHRVNQTQLFIAKHAFSHSEDNSAKTGQTD